jgi:hypothetical protein
MNSAFHLYLSGQEAMLRRESGFWQRKVEELARWRWNQAEPASFDLPDLPEAGKGRAGLHVYPGSALCRLMVVPCPPRLRDQAERNAVAAAQMSSQLGLNVGDWCFTTSLDADQGKLFVCAMRQALLERLRETAARKRLKLRVVAPYAQAVWNALAASRDGDGKLRSLIVVEPDALAVFSAKGRLLQTMGTLFHRRESGLVEREVSRARLMSGEAEHEVGVALLAGVGDLVPAQGHADILSDELVGRRLYADFRDLAFMEGSR